jgi:hypothetical protein
VLKKHSSRETPTRVPNLRWTPKSTLWTLFLWENEGSPLAPYSPCVSFSPARTLFLWENEGSPLAPYSPCVSFSPTRTRRRRPRDCPEARPLLSLRWPFSSLQRPIPRSRGTGSAPPCGLGRPSLRSLRLSLARVARRGLCVEDFRGRRKI